MKRVLLFLALTAALAGLGPVPLEADGGSDALRADLDVENRLLEREIVRYREAHESMVSLRDAWLEAAEALEDAVTAKRTDLNEVSDLEAAFAEAEVARTAAMARLEGSRSRILEHRRRLDVLRRELRGRTEARLGGDPLSGTWEVTVAAPPLTGRFELELSGADVTGTYEMDNDRTGSLRGSLVGDRLKLERVDSIRGLDGVFEGTLDPERGVVVGFWTPSILGEGGPAGAGWSAIRVGRNTAQDSE